MCGRFAQYQTIGTYMDELDPGWQIAWEAEHGMPEHSPSWNVSPGKMPWVATRQEDTGYLATRMEWGFKPAWAKESMRSVINARVETAAKKPYFRNAWKDSRCVVPVDNYYEWLETDGIGKTPYCIQNKNGSAMLLAGLHARQAQSNGNCFAVITKAALGDIATLHHRMPLILSPDMARAWLDPKLDEVSLGKFISYRDKRSLTWHKVSNKLNNANNDGMDLIVKAS